MSYFTVIPSSSTQTANQPADHRSFMLVDDVAFDRNEFNRLGLANDNSNYGISTSSLFDHEYSTSTRDDLNDIIEDLTGIHI